MSDLVEGLNLARNWCERWKPDAEIMQPHGYDRPVLKLVYHPNGPDEVHHAYVMDMDQVSERSVLDAIHSLQDMAAIYEDTKDS